jgi:hypothetical protein
LCTHEHKHFELASESTRYSFLLWVGNILTWLIYTIPLISKYCDDLMAAWLSKDVGVFGMDTLLTVLNYNLQSIALLIFHTVYLQFTTHALGPLCLLSFTSPLVLVSIGRCSISWVPTILMP